MHGHLAALYAAQHAPLVAMLTDLVGDAATAEDVCQDVFVRALALGAALPGLDGARAWLEQTARRLAEAALRERAERAHAPLAACRILVDPTAREGGASPEAAILGDLPARQRAALLLQADGLTWAECAAELGCTPDDVRCSLAAARRALSVYDLPPARRGRRKTRARAAGGGVS